MGVRAAPRMTTSGSGITHQLYRTSSEGSAVIDAKSAGHSDSGADSARCRTECGYAAALVSLFLSPKREFLADAAAAELCKSPHGLADALIRLEQTGELVEFQASPATEPLYTINPFAEEGLAALFVTHPPVAERVRRLRALDPTWREKLRAA